MNAVKHGLTARTPVLPGEDPDAFRGRLDDWSEALAPADVVEQFLVEQAATASWKIERADRIEAARLFAALRAAEDEQCAARRKEADSLGRLLLGIDGPAAAFGGSHLDPDLIAADLAAEPVHRVAPDGRAAAVGQPEPPAVQRADHLAFLDPPQPQRPIGMRTPARQHHHLAPDAEHRHPHPVGVARDAPPFLDLVQSADRDPFGHRPTSPHRAEGNRESDNL